MSYVIHEIPFPDVHRDLSIQAGLLEHASLPFAGTVHSVHRADLGADYGP